MLREISKKTQNPKKTHIPACGSTGRQDGAPPVAIGSATEFATFHHLSVLGLETMQKIYLASAGFPFLRPACI